MKGISNIINILEGGKGSGHFGHKGIPDHQGGSLPSGVSVISPKDIDPDVASPETIKSIHDGDYDIKTASGIIWKKTYQGDYYFFVTVHGDDGTKEYKVSWLTKKKGFESEIGTLKIIDNGSVLFEDGIVFPVTPSTLADYAMEKVSNLKPKEAEVEIINTGELHNDPWDDALGRAGLPEVPEDRIKGIAFPDTQIDWEASRNTKDHVCQSVSEEARVEYHDVDQILQSWAESAVSNNSMIVHKSIAGIMGYELTEKLEQGLESMGIKRGPLDVQDEALAKAWTWDKSVEDRVNVDKVWGETRPLAPMTGQKLQRVVEAVYERTQEYLQSKGIGKYDYVKLYRGVTYPANPRDDQLFAHKGGDIVSYGGKPVASWSTRLETARNFGYEGVEKSGYVLEMYVPRWTIFSTALTGIGCLNESEALVFGDDLGHLVKIKEVRRGYE
jgi:hypothetical protein